MRFNPYKIAWQMRHDLGYGPMAAMVSITIAAAVWVIVVVSLLLR